MEDALLQAVRAAIADKKFLKIQYYSEINEFMTVTALIKELSETEKGLTVELASGEEILFGQLVRVGKVASDKYDTGYFKCDL